MKTKIGLFYQYIFSYKFKPVFRCKQIDNKNFKTLNFKTWKFYKEKKNFFRILKIGHGIALYSKNFFSVFQN